MLRPVKMVHLRIQVPNRDAARMARCIASEGLLHLVDVAHGRAPAGPPEGVTEQRAVFQELQRRVRRTAGRLGLPLPEPVGHLEIPAAEDLAAEARRLGARLAPVEAEAEARWRRASETAEETARLETALGWCRRLAGAGVDPARLRDLRFATVRLGLARPEDYAALATLLSPAPFAVVPLESAAGAAPVLAAVAVPAASRGRLDDTLRVVPFEAVPVPEAGEGWDPETLAGRRDAAAASREEARRALEAARGRLGPVLAELAGRIDLAVLLLDAQAHFAAAGRFTVVSGWVPADRAEALRRAVERATEGRAVVDLVVPESLPEVAAGLVRVPILHRNPLLLRPFQRLVQIYGTPSYRELEPTAFFAVSFLLMFGLMFGDVGHGLVLFSAGFLLFRHFPRYLDYGVLLMEAAAASTVFGLLYGSFFGIEGLLPVLWMEPLEDLSAFMEVAVVFGLVLVSAGLVLGIVNAWRSGEKARALFGTRGLLGATIYWVVVVVLVRALVPSRLVLPGWALFALAAVPLLLLALRPFIVRRLEGEGAIRREAAVPGPVWLRLLEGAVDLVDTLFSFFANTVSFVRIAAFAAVHAGIFLALFAITDTLASVRFGGALSVVVLVVGNVVAILLEGLTVSVQVLRLEYYEFFGKFFRGGGEPYRPFGASRTGGAP